MLALVYENNLQAGSHLPETFFAESLKVSRTPIRAALSYLESKGVVKKEPNRGYFLVSCDLPELDEMVGLVVDRDSPISSLAFDIAVDYLNGKLTRTISETELSNIYGANRFAIQQALSSMESEGWVSKLMGYGWEFNEFLTSRETYDQCFRFRIVIEPAALREPGYRVNRKVFKTLRKSLSEALVDVSGAISERQMYLNGTFFHESIVACSNNMFFLESLQRANRLRRLIEYNIYSRRESPKPEYEEHLAILDLLETGRNEEAATFLTRHLERARRDKIRISEDIFAT